MLGVGRVGANLVQACPRELQAHLGAIHARV